MIAAWLYVIQRSRSRAGMNMSAKGRSVKRFQNIRSGPPESVVSDECVTF